MWAKPVTKLSGVRSVILCVISEANPVSCEALTRVVSTVTPSVTPAAKTGTPWPGAVANLGWGWPAWQDPEYVSIFSGRHEMLEAELLLLGRVTYEGFSGSWPQRDGEVADESNRCPKDIA